jgi:hypothetical protein
VQEDLLQNENLLLEKEGRIKITLGRQGGSISPEK